MPPVDAIFLINLLQDVNIARPIIYMAARDLGLNTRILVCEKFFERDRSGVWRAELTEIAAATRAQYFTFGSEFEALRLLQGRAGVLVAASESNLPAHAIVHDVMRLAPGGFVRITLQHGFEGVGFLQSREHDLAHGTEVTFAADVLCGWFPGERQTSMAPSQRPKLYVSGPPAVLQMHRRSDARRRDGVGIVCENLHSVRLNVAGDFKADFVTTFGEFCAALAAEGRSVALRPHPGGQYVVKKDVPLPANVVLDNEPIYRVDLADYAYGLSAPSSVLIDMMLAGIPVAVWRDGGGTIDAGNYAGLAEVSSVSDWLAFGREAVAHPERFLEPQRQFIERQSMPTDPRDVYRRFATLLREAAGVAGRRAAAAVRPSKPDEGVAEAQRVLFVANDLIPTLQLSFIKPLGPCVADGSVVTEFVTEREIRRRFPPAAVDEAVAGWLNARLESFRPTAIVFCRYSGRNARSIVEWARRARVPVVYHVDDDLLNVPIEIGQEKYKAHNEPARLETVRFLLDESDLVYCSTGPLAKRFRALGVVTPFAVGEIYCSGAVMTPAPERTSRKIGYMGFDHAHDFETMLPALVRLLRKRPSVTFELFGSIPKPPALDEFGARVTVVPPVRDYDQFMREFALLGWDIGICPLAKTDFNLLKADTKWVEYTAVGAAVVAAQGTVYDACCADGCGVLADTEDEWFAALDRLVAQPRLRVEQVRRAQEKLKAHYSTESLRLQILDVFSRAESAARAAERVMFLSPTEGATLQLSFTRPLSAPEVRKRITFDTVSIRHLKEIDKDKNSVLSNRDWLLRKLESFSPTIIVFSRYNVWHAHPVVEWARRRAIPTVYHIDDDLLAVPTDLGEEKAAVHNEPAKLATVRRLLDEVDLVYASTDRLRERLLEAGAKAPVVAGKIYCPGTVISPAVMRPVRKVGYMASADHAHNLKPILPAIAAYLRRHAEVAFELFGSIPRPPELEEFGERVRQAEPINDYERFLQEFAKAEWDIGICPLAPIPFNLMKANTKWVEYTSVGAAVIASRGTVYDACCADGCGLLAQTPDEWLAALETLTADPAERYAQVARAQKRLTDEFSTDRLVDQVLDVFEMAKANAAAAFLARTA